MVCLSATIKHMPVYSVEITRTVTAHIEIFAENKDKALMDARKKADFMATSRFNDTVIEDEIVIVENE